jgi:hypothetical protein
MQRLVNETNEEINLIKKKTEMVNESYNKR